MSAHALRHFNPFPGLRPFRSDEHHLFFGRENQTAALLELLRSHRFLAIVGTSGSGKSSLVRAGLIPALHRGTMTKAGSNWEVVVQRPGGNPIDNMARALIKADFYDADDPESLPRLKATLSRSLYGLVEAIKQSDVLDSSTNLLFVVDQFEEVFRFRQQNVQSEDTAGAFVSLLLTAAEQQEQPIYVAITMRSDYLGDCSNIPGLADAVNRGEYLIPRLMRDQKRDAIEMPVGVGGAKIAPRLVQRMLNDVGDDPDQLPVLQHALMRTYDVWFRSGTSDVPVDLSHYEATGGMEEALSRHADEIYNELATDRHRLVCERILRTLTEKGSDNRGIRRPTRMQALEQIVGADQQTVSDVVEAFRAPGVTFLMPAIEQDLSDRTVVDLSHESLMRVWKRLDRWVETEAQSARIYRRLADTATLWKEGKAGLYRDPDLQIALSWRDREEPNAAWAAQYGGEFALADDFLDQSQEVAHAEARRQEEARQRELEQANALAEAQSRRAQEQQRAAKGLRILAAGVGLVALVAIIASFMAASARRDALANARIAEVKSIEAERNAKQASENAIAASQNAQLAQEKEQAATQAADRLQQMLADSDFNVGVEKVVAGDGSGGLSHLARAMRTDPDNWQAGLRVMSTLAAGRFSLTPLKPLEQTRVISDYWYHEQQELMLTRSSGNADEMPEGIVWDMQTGQQLYQVEPDRHRFRHPGWSPDGHRLFGFFTEGNQVLSWNARTGERVGPVIEIGNDISDLRVGQTDAGLVVLVRNNDRSLRLWNAETGQPISPLIQGTGPSYGQIEFTPDFKHFYAAFSDGILGVWRTADGERVRELSGRPLRVEGGQARTYVSPDGNTLVVRGDNAKRMIWWSIDDEDSGGEWIQLEQPSDISFLPGGQRILVSPQNGEPDSEATEVAAVYDLATGEKVMSIRRPQAPRRIALPLEVPYSYQSSEATTATPLMRFPVIASVEAIFVRLWDLETGKEIRQIVAPSLLNNACFSPDGRQVATVSVENDVMLWDVFTGTRLLRDTIRHTPSSGAPTPIFSPDGTKMVTHDQDTQLVSVWTTATGDRIVEPVSQMFVRSRSTFFSPDVQRLVLYDFISSSSGNFRRQTVGRMQLINVGLRPILFETIFHRNGRNAATARFTPDGKKLVVLGRRDINEPERLFVFDALSRQLLYSIPLPQDVGGQTDTLELAPDSQRILMACDDRVVRLWDLNDGSLVREISMDSMVMQLAVSHDGSRFATGTFNGQVRVWDIATGAAVSDVLQHGDDAIRMLEFNRDGQLLISGSRDAKLRFTNPTTGEEVLPALEMNNFFDSIAFHPDGVHAVVSAFEQSIAILDLSTGEIVRRLPNNNACRQVRFSPDGRLVAVGLGGLLDAPTGQAATWDWRQGRRIGRPMELKGAGGQVQFSPDGQLLATGTVYQQGGAVQVWHVASRQPVTDPVVGLSGVRLIDFHPSGTQIVASWNDGAVKVIDIPPRDPTYSQWLPELAEAVGGLRMAAGGEGAEEVPPDQIDLVRQEMQSNAEDVTSSSGTKWGRWFFAKPNDRTISPGSSVTFGQHLARLRQGENESQLREALQLVPADALTHARLGGVLIRSLEDQNDLSDDLKKHWSNTAEWYTRRAVQLAPEDPDVWGLRSEVLRSVGRSLDADLAVRHAVELVGKNEDLVSPNTRYLHAVMLAAQGNWSESDAAMNQALDELSAIGSSETSTAPLLGFLPRLLPFQAPTGMQRVHLPDPIPGTFEDFESTPEGGVPEGWITRHWTSTLSDPAARPNSLADATSRAYDDWTVIAIDRIAKMNWDLSVAERILDVGARELVNGQLKSALANGRFLFALSHTRLFDHAQIIETPDFDCSNQLNVHVAFNSIYEQNQNNIAYLEYSIDAGETWLPVLYMIDGADLVENAGELDAVATLTEQRDNLPWVYDDQGGRRAGSYSEFIGTEITPQLAAHLQGRRNDDETDSKRIEIHRVAAADGQPKVRFRFVFAGSNSWYWGIDDFGLYSVAGQCSEPVDEIDPRTIAPLLAGLGYSSFLGVEPRLGTRMALNAHDFATPRVSLEDSPTDDIEQNSLAPGSWRRRTIDAALLLRRAASLQANDRLTNLTAVALTSRAGIDTANATVVEAIQSQPLDILAVRPLADYWLGQGDRYWNEDDRKSAAVCYELSYILFQSCLQGLPKEIMQRLTKSGLRAKGAKLLPRESVWRVWDQGRIPSPDWNSLAFDDSRWITGKARLGYGDQQNSVVSSGPDSNRKYTTTYFRTTVEIDYPDSIVQLTLRLQRDDGAVVYINGEEVLRDAMPSGEITYDTFANVTASADDETTFFEFDVPASALRSGTNVIAAEVHQVNPTSSDLGFDLEIEAYGGLNDDILPTEETARIEQKLNLPDTLRSILWISRARRFHAANKLNEATAAATLAAELAPENPAVEFHELITAAEDIRPDDYLKTAQAAASLKADPTLNTFRLFLPPSLQSVEPLVDPDGLSWLQASGSAQLATREANWLFQLARSKLGDRAEDQNELIQRLMDRAQHEEALALADEFLHGLTVESARDLRLQKQFLRLRERCLRALDRNEEANQVRDEIFKFPSRDPKLSDNQLDLSEHYNASIYDSRRWHSTQTLSMLPETFQPHHGVDFDLRGLIQLNSGVYPDSLRGVVRNKDINESHDKDYPSEVKGIPVGRKAARIHFLTSTIWGRADKDEEVSSFVIHYDDETQEKIPILFERDVRDWAVADFTDPVTQAWRSHNPSRALSIKTWENPHSDKQISHIDFISAMKAAGPFLVAITTE